MKKKKKVFYDMQKPGKTPENPANVFTEDLFDDWCWLINDHGGVDKRRYNKKVCNLDTCNKIIMPKKVVSGKRTGHWEMSSNYNKNQFCNKEHSYKARGQINTAYHAAMGHKVSGKFIPVTPCGQATIADIARQNLTSPADIWLMSSL